MTSAALLLTFAIAAGTRGVRWLAQSSWTSTAPRLAIATWQALAASVLLSLFAAGAALSISLKHIEVDLADLYRLCADSLQQGYVSPGGTANAIVGLGIAVLVVSRTAWSAFRVSRQVRHERRSWMAVIDLIGRADMLPGVLVLDHDVPYAFCIGGPSQRVVVTQGLLETLNREELEAVLAHERAHLQQRHHIALRICRTLFGALLPFFPAFRTAMSRVLLLAELSADDSARRRTGDYPLRAALTRLACLPAPSGTLAASAIDVETRLRRLSDDQSDGHRHRVMITGVGVASLVAIPLTFVAAATVALTWGGICLIG